MEETVIYYLEMLESRGQVSHEDRASMLESYVQFIGKFRDNHSEDDDLGAHESELWQYGTANLSLQRLMQWSFCVSGSVNQTVQFAYPSVPVLKFHQKSNRVCCVRF